MIFISMHSQESKSENAAHYPKKRWTRYLWSGWKTSFNFLRRAIPDPGSWLQPQAHYHNATLTIHENRKWNEINMLALKLSLLLTTLSSQIFKYMLLNHSKTSICVTALIVSIAFSVSIQQATFSQKPENHSNKIIYLNVFNEETLS